MKPRLYIDQKITPFVNKYKIFGIDPATGAKGGLIGLAQQKRQSPPDVSGAVIDDMHLLQADLEDVFLEIMRRETHA